MIYILLTLLVLISKSQNNQCIWAQNYQQNTFQTLFQYPQHGNCIYSTLNSNFQKLPSQQFLFFLDGISFCSQKQPNMECILQHGPPGLNCTAKCVQFFQMGEYPPIQISLTLPQKTYEYSDLRIQLALKQDTSIKQCQSKINLDLNNIIIKAKIYTQTQQLHKTNKNFQFSSQIRQCPNSLIFNLFIIILIFLSWKQKTILIYNSLQIGLFIQILLVSAKWILTHFSAKLNTWELIITITINLMMILFHLKKFFHFVDHSTLSFSKNIPFPSQNQYNQIPIQNTSKNKTQNISFPQMLCRKYNKIIEQIIKIYMSIQWLIMLTFVLLSLCKYQLIFCIIWGFLAIISSHYLKFYGINASALIITDSFQLDQKQISKIISQQRDSVLFPKFKITSYFIITILKIILNYNGVIQLLYWKMIFQIFYIIIIWIITIVFVHKQIQTIKGKKTYLFKIKNAKNQSNPQCSICLSEIYQQSIKTECNHVFHPQCLSEWTKTKKICPIQRNTLNANSLQNCFKKFQKQKRKQVQN